MPMIQTTQGRLRATAAAEPPTPDIRDIVPPVPIPSVWDWMKWVVLVLVAAALGYVLWKIWRRRRARIIEVPAVPPHVKARQRLETALALLDQPREFCIAVSDAVRWYLEERFELHAPERTTEEFLAELQRSDRLLPDQKQTLGEFLQKCDLVKFARYEPSRPELLALHGAAWRLVAETEPALVSGERGPLTADAGAVRDAKVEDRKAAV
jgi:hypothetical protein